MKKRKLIVIIILLILFAVILLFYSFYNDKGKDEEPFQLTFEKPQKLIQKDEEVIFTARLTNLTDKEYTLYHGVPLISLYIRGKDDKTPEGIYAMQVKSKLEPSGYIEQSLNIKALEAGEYILRASSIFSIGDKKYELNCEDVPIIVEDN